MIADFGGLSKQLPIYATLFMIMTLSSIGLPALNGFIGEFTILVGAWQIPTSLSLALPFTGKVLVLSPKFWVVCAVFGIVLGAAYMLWLYQRTMFGKLDKPENQALKDLNFRECMTLIPLVVLAFWIGLYPKPFFDILQPSVHRLVEQVSDTGGLSASVSTSAAGASCARVPVKTAFPSPPEPTNE
jgi:NADH-quinone oxidoreductase subunit M